VPSYRFCRPDDVPFLVRAVNECFAAHFPGTPAMTVDSFRREMKELDLWPSSCMIALTDTDPVAVLTGTKRESETLVSRVGVRPGEEGRGHGGHLLSSLAQKLAVLGPPRLVAEVPADLPRVCRFFERQGWRREVAFTDWRRPAGGEVAAVPEGLVIPATVDELLASGALEVPAGAAWVRTRQSLTNRRETLRGLAVASPDRHEAWLLHAPAADGEPVESVEVVGFGTAGGERRELLLGALLRQLVRETAGPVRLAHLADDELPPALLASLGFEPEAQYHRYATEARAL
jgi:GNAT superfamily N-acetyltransferase